MLFRSVIGGTGSGKSTLVSLIPRFYDATEGKVLLKGVPIENLKEEVLRKTVAVVQQKAQLFAGTIRSNLLWGNEQATDGELWQALEQPRQGSLSEKKVWMLPWSRADAISPAARSSGLPSQERWLPSRKF